MFNSILNYLLGWESVYTTQKVEDYARIKGKLNNNGIKTRTKMDTPGRAHNRGMHFGSSITTYDILVKKVDIHKANEAIHRK
ncbi:MAG: hypothetical protein FH758_14225 [Firmicutes bacterium]|nr:hypothetical protein [Bacillota bacterium]